MRALRLLAVLIVLAGCGSGERELLPDLDQAVPSAISIEQRGARRILVFASAVENKGDGPLLVEGSRRDRAEAEMEARQVIVRTDGSRETTAPIGVIRYVRSETHEHWHLLDFERYELRTPGGRLVRPAAKTGFCLGDRYEISALDLPREPPAPVETRECGRHGSGLLHVDEGISVGYGDDYVPELEGQWIDVTGLPAGRYLLVHRVNTRRSLRETDYTNDAASVLLEIGRDGGRVRVVIRCPDSGTCPGRRA